MDLSKYEPKKRAAIERLRDFQLSDQHEKVELVDFEVDQDGKIVLDPNDPLAREWYGSDGEDDQR